MKKRIITERPSAELLEAELDRIRRAKHCRMILKSTVCRLITAAAAAVLIANLWLPVLRIYGSSMAPTLRSGEIVLCVKTKDAGPGDIIAFYHNNQMLVKRIIAGPGDQVDLCPRTGTVFVNHVPLEEPYLTEKAFGKADIEFPYAVADGKFFIMGDHRSTSVDSRHAAVGCVSEEQIVGKIIFRIWPLDQFGGF